MLNCCTPTAKRMGILGIAQLLVALYLYIYIIYIYIYIYICIYSKKEMHAGKYHTRISTFLPEPTCHFYFFRHFYFPA